MTQVSTLQMSSVKRKCKCFSKHISEQDNTMASSYSSKTPLLSQIPHILLWFQLLLDLTLTSTLTGIDPQSYFEGIVGGSVNLTCPVDKNKNVRLMYLQRHNTFVNGYHYNRPDLKGWENTQLDSQNSAVLISNLNASHAGEYECIIDYDKHETVTTTLHLNVTAPYKNPVVTNSCKEENGGWGCHVTCTFHDGFPKNKIQWDVAETGNGRAKMQITEESTKEDPITKMSNISSTAYINCSSGEQKVSCTVGRVTSNTSLVCTSEVKPFPPMYVVAAVILLVLVSVLLLVLLICKKKKAEPSEYIATANIEDGLDLTESRKETEAS